MGGVGIGARVTAGVSDGKGVGKVELVGEAVAEGVSATDTGIVHVGEAVGLVVEVSVASGGGYEGVLVAGGASAGDTVIVHVDVAEEVSVAEAVGVVVEVSVTGDALRGLSPVVGDASRGLSLVVGGASAGDTVIVHVGVAEEVSVGVLADKAVAIDVGGGMGVSDGMGDAVAVVEDVSVGIATGAGFGVAGGTAVSDGDALSASPPEGVWANVGVSADVEVAADGTQGVPASWPARAEAFVGDEVAPAISADGDASASPASWARSPLGQANWTLPAAHSTTQQASVAAPNLKARNRGWTE
jgi:hypothetical protein